MRKLFLFLILALGLCAWAQEPIPIADPVIGQTGTEAAAPFKITSANFDTSNAMIVLSAQDTDAPIMTNYKLVTMEDPKRAYFDINDAIITFPKQDWKFENSPVQQIRINQFETTPTPIVRVVLNVDDKFNASNIKILRINNTIIVKLKPDQFAGSDYLHNTYRDERTSAADFYEYTKPRIGADETPQNLRLNTGYYIQSISTRRDAVLINGFGSLTVEKPLILTDPNRIVYDLPNTYVAPEIRNTEYKLSDKEPVKLGQFSVNKARLVLQVQNPADFIPIFSADNQSLLIANLKKVSSSNLTAVPSSITAYKKEKKDLTSTMRLSFSEPLIHGVERGQNKLTLYLYNVKNLNEEAFKTAFADTVFSKGITTGSKISIPLENNTVVNTFLGADNKTLVVKITEPKKQDKPKTTGKTIVLDPGHGGTDCGALSGNLLEKDINLTVAKKLRDILVKQGHSVYMTRDDDTYVSLEDRVTFAEKHKPDIFISIHVNSSVKPEINGLETHHWRPDSLALAQVMHDRLVKDIKANDRGLFKSQFYVINHTTMPAVLLEIGFISNNIERGQLAGESRKNATAKAIAEGVNNYFRGK